MGTPHFHFAPGPTSYAPGPTLQRPLIWPSTTLSREVVRVTILSLQEDTEVPQVQVHCPRAQLAMAGQ